LILRQRHLPLRRVYLSNWQSAPVFDLETLAEEQTIEGPTIGGAATTTVLVREADLAIVGATSVSFH